MNSEDSKKGPPPGNPSYVPAEPGEATTVDLGEDLLGYTASLAGATRPLERPPEPAPGEEFDGPVAPDQIEDQMESARILTREGLTDEAKRVLRKILIVDPHHVVARKALQEIHETELKQLFGEERRRISVRRRSSHEAVPTESEAEELLRTLDRDLRLGIDEETHPLMSSVEDQEKYAQALESQLTTGPSLAHGDRVDLGIAFMEMGLPAVALKQFRAAQHALSADPAAEADALLAAQALCAQALIALGRAFDAILEIQPVLRDTEIKVTSKLEFFYQMGRAYESLGKDESARKWFEQARQVDPRYRDVEERLRRPT